MRKTETMNARVIALQSVCSKLSATFRESSGGTPHVLVTHKGVTYSIAYFTANKGRSAKYRIFWPYPSRGVTQKKRDCMTEDGVVRFFDGVALSNVGSAIGWF